MSRLPFELMLALRYLRPKRTFVSVITLISIIGVTLGVAVLIIVISVMSGFDKQLREKLLGFNSHLKVYQRNTPMHDYAVVASTIQSNANVTAVVPFVLGQVLIETEPATGNPQQSTPWLRGVSPELEGKVSVLPSHIKEGKFDLSGNGVLVGGSLAQMLHLHVGDRIAIYSSRAIQKFKESKGKGENILPDDYTVNGIFDLGYYEYDSSVIVTSLANAQDLYNLNDSVHGLMVMTKDANDAAEVEDQLYAALGNDFYITTWASENSQLLSALMVEKQMMLYLLFFIVLVAAFGITSALITFVVQKTREIGILKSLGASSSQVMLLFLSQSLVVGVVGVVCGFVMGMLAVHYRNEFLLFMRHLTGVELFPQSIYEFSELPALIIAKDIAIICGGSFIICILAGVFPAWNAGRLKPVEALRHE